MGPGKDDFGLRLAAKAADREKAARRQWPAFEERLKELGYGPRAIAHAFRTLSGPGTVAEALEALNDMSRPESHPVALRFEVTGAPGGPSATNGVTITSVGGHFGLARDGWRGGLTIPLPPAAATILRIRITWDAPPSSIWEGPAHEVRVPLGD